MTGHLAVVTIAAGRRRRLVAQAITLASQTRPPDRYVVVDMGGPSIGEIPAHRDTDVEIIRLPADPGELPLAAARNLGVSHAEADLTVLLDVDCVVLPTTIGEYADAAAEHPDAIHCGPVGYLPPGPVSADLRPSAQRSAVYQPGRPRPGDGCGPTPRLALFWSLSFAVTSTTWSLLDGFDEGYVGYGGEDTDFAMRARDRAVPIWFHGHAEAFHLHHPTHDPPTQHLASICRNATRFYRRWHWWPMTGWLRQFERDGLITWDPLAGTVEPVTTTRAAT